MWRHTDRWDWCSVVVAVEAYLLNANKSQALTRYPAAEEKFNADLQDRISKQWLSKALAVPAWLIHRFFLPFHTCYCSFIYTSFFIFHCETYCNFQDSKLCLQWKKSIYWNEGAKTTWQTLDRQTHEDMTHETSPTVHLHENNFYLIFTNFRQLRLCFKH